MRPTLLAVGLALALTVSSFGLASANHSQTAGSRTTSFDHKTGNEWWVEVIVAGSPSSVQARDDGGSWVALELKSWGAWAKSFHIEPGHRVQFRATWSNGDAAESCWFTHPAGVEECAGSPPPPPPPPPSAFTFTHGGGNEWWVEVKVSPMPGKVEAMDTGGAWTPLSFRSWGEWANSFHIEPGNQVKFRALAPDGVWHESCWFSHPAGVMQPCTAPPPPPPPPAWPVEGSFVKYVASSGESFGEQYQEETELNVTYTYQGGQWMRHDEGWSRQWWNIGSEDERYNETRIDETSAAAPPSYSLALKPGDTGGEVEGTVFGPIRATFEIGGVSKSLVVMYSEYSPVWPAYHVDMWDTSTGLTLSWYFVGSHSYHAGGIVDTDAPLADTPKPRTSWPFEGSFVRYKANKTGGDTRVDIDYTFTDGGWYQRCTVYEGSEVVGSFENPGAPFHGPSGVAVGDWIEVPLPEHCGAEWNELLVERTQSLMTTRNGAAYKAKVWYADEDDSWDVDFDVWWDANTRLYVEWDFNEWQGKLVNTDAPLARG